MEEMEQVVQIFPQKLRVYLQDAGTENFQAQELRLRAGQPFLMLAEGAEWFLSADGSRWEMVKKAGNTSRQINWVSYHITSQDIQDTLEYMSRYSLYAFDEEVRQGYLTIPGGHRIGLAGQAVLEGQNIRTLKQISFLNVRIARQIPGCADQVLPAVYPEGKICSALIISPPRCGKTTLLRDLIRQISNGWQFNGLSVPGITVGVVDERSELGACCQGIPQNDLGMRTDVLDGCPKAEGMMMLIRSMAPQVVAVDEIGSRKDMEALLYACSCGCRLLATVHGSSLEDIFNKPVLRELMEMGVFSRYIVLDSEGVPGQIKGIFDGGGRLLTSARY